MHLVQLLLPLTDNEHTPFPPALYAQVRADLTARFGGLTAYVRAPAHGEWEDDGERVHDDVVIYEVMVEVLDRAWWAHYRETVRVQFRQEALVVRALPFERL
ncbi:hypothetical protein [Deinococcus maricopensis]|uniref:Uncharacterized protein n=1 Tax=Deinococcus maricopensis (strain DSM 21211 / LMG 22137 / NRRL B-23946 / LB-34) TaxID=709986 RepID=E8U6V4_DEIML|nr:hypothetical protein [Deinococcus maricopensis]ADV66793.1 hypothetical protein Deima_1141 [Deinococcus maricopensis DSM 21211]